MTIAIQQPEHVPWMGFFNKMSQVDLLVLLDNVQFKKRYFENRNKIRTAQGFQWVTVPVLTKERYTQWIKEVEIDHTGPWRRKYLSSIVQAYSKAPCFSDRWDLVEPVLERPWEKLVDLNIALIQTLSAMCEIRTETVLASRIDTGESRGSDLILGICRHLESEVYVSGPDGRNYLNLEAFYRAGIQVVYHDYEHPSYPQRYSPFISHMSLLDYVFNVPDTTPVRSSYTIPLPC